jgi:hypothetical protein
VSGQPAETDLSLTAVPLVDSQPNLRCYVLGHSWHEERIGFSSLHLTACTRCGETRP